MATNSNRLLANELREKLRDEDTVTLNPPRKIIVLTPEQRGRMEAYGYARSMYMSGCSLECGR